MNTHNPSFLRSYNPYFNKIKGTHHFFMGGFGVSFLGQALGLPSLYFPPCPKHLVEVHCGDLFGPASRMKGLGVVRWYMMMIVR